MLQRSGHALDWRSADFTTAIGCLTLAEQGYPAAMTHLPADRSFFSLRIRPSGFVDIALLMALSGTWLGLFGGLHWALDLFSHFRWQYLVACLVGVVWSFALKRPRWIQALCLASLLVNAASLYLVKGNAAFAATTGDPLRVVSLNVLKVNDNKQAVLEYLRSSDADVLFLMEVDVPWSEALSTLTEAYPHYRFWPQDDNFGLALLSRVPLQGAQIVQTSVMATPSILARLNYSGRELAIFGVHPVPPVRRIYSAARDAQLAETAAIVADLDVPVLLIGDLNATPWSRGFRLLRNGTSLDFHSPDPAWTPTWNALVAFAIPIDHALTTPPLEVTRRQIGPDVGSDHRPQLLEIAWQN